MAKKKTRIPSALKKDKGFREIKEGVNTEKKIRAFVEKNLKKGYNLGTIKRKLIASNFPRNSVKTVVREFEKKDLVVSKKAVIIMFVILGLIFALLLFMLFDSMDPLDGGCVNSAECGVDRICSAGLCVDKQNMLECNLYEDSSTGESFYTCIIKE